MAMHAPVHPVDSVEQGLRQLFRWGNLPRFRERFTARAGLRYDRASYLLIAPLGERPMRISELAHRSGVDVSTASRQIVQLEREGVVRRQTDPSDARASILALTPLGEQNLVTIGRARRADRPSRSQTESGERPGLLKPASPSG